MPLFSSPVYSKTDTGAASYTFTIEFGITEDLPSYVINQPSEISLTGLQMCITEHVAWWETFLTDYLRASSKYFSKAYSVSQLNKITKHALLPLTRTDPLSTPTTVQFQPQTITITGGMLTIYWRCAVEPVQILLPEDEEEVPDSEKGVEEVDADDVPWAADLSEDEFSSTASDHDSYADIEDPRQRYDLQKVREARLKAKLAIYRAEWLIRKYYDTYGEEYITEDEDEDRDEDEDDQEDDEENEQHSK